MVKNVIYLLLFHSVAWFSSAEREATSLAAAAAAAGNGRNNTHIQLKSTQSQLCEKRENLQEQVMFYEMFS